MQQKERREIDRGGKGGKRVEGRGRVSTVCRKAFSTICSSNSIPIRFIFFSTSTGTCCPGAGATYGTSISASSMCSNNHCIATSASSLPVILNAFSARCAGNPISCNCTNATSFSGGKEGLASAREEVDSEVSGRGVSPCCRPRGTRNLSNEIESWGTISGTSTVRTTTGTDEE